MAVGKSLQLCEEGPFNRFLGIGIQNEDGYRKVSFRQNTFEPLIIFLFLFYLYLYFFFLFSSVMCFELNLLLCKKFSLNKS